MAKREKTIRARLFEPKQGDVIIYHSGHTLKGADPWSIARARTLYDDGLAELVQARNSDGHFDYIAQIRRYPIAREREYTFRYNSMRYAEKFHRSFSE